MHLSFPDLERTLKVKITAIFKISFMVLPYFIYGFCLLKNLKLHQFNNLKITLKAL